MTSDQLTDLQAPVTDEELDQMIWKLERDGMTPKMLSLMRELRELRRNSPATPDGWIPVSERMPESNGVYFGWDGKRVLQVNCFFGGFSANQFIHGEITHWIPLPAAPQEVQGE